MHTTAALRAVALACLLSAAPLAAQAERSLPTAQPRSDTIPAAQDIAYPGTMSLAIDATDVNRGLFRVTQTIPVQPGTRELVLLLPQWLPGNHAPTGNAALINDLRLTAGGKPLTWRRDPVDVYAFRVALPQGTREVTARFVHTAPLQASEGRVTMTREMLNLQWEKMSLYPAGHYVRQIRVKPSVKAPAGWTVFTALDGHQVRGQDHSWAATDYETLVDSPIFAGAHATRTDLGQSVWMDALADKPELLAIQPQHMQTYRNLVSEGLALFKTRPFDHYDFLLALTDRMGGIGLEHHRSSENQYEPRSWIEWDKMDWDHNVIPHEFVHSWNGKHRRPADLWTPDYRVPMQGSLLWVYEGQTQFWGNVLAARSGVQSKDTVLAILANDAATYSEGQPGRGWRSVEDTTADPVIAYGRSSPNTSLSRARDYYREAAMVWLEADQLIRAESGGTRSLDDFAAAFFGGREGDWGQRTYDFAEVVRTLNAVHPHDWATFLDTRIRTPGQPAPLAGITLGGYRLVWKDRPTAYDEARWADAKSTNLFYSLGLTLDNDGKVTGTRWDSPAFDAGLVTTAQIIGVNDRAYSADALRGAVTAAKGRQEPIRLLVKRGDAISTVSIPYAGGLRYPWLEKVGTGEAGLDRLLAPKAAR